jgi:tetratricopeptide (TPR) repeat protein
LFPSRRFSAIVSIAAANATLWSCASRTTANPSSLGSGARESTLAQQEVVLARTLILMGRQVASPEERGWLARVDASLGTTEDARAVNLERRMRSMLAADFTPEERLLVLAQGEVHLAYELISANRFSEAREAARFVLSKENVSAQIQRWALSAWMIAHALALPSPPDDFNALQRLHCDELCPLPGWRLVSEEDGGSLSRVGYNDRLLTNLQFELAGKKRPRWLSALVESPPQAATQTPAESEPNVHTNNHSVAVAELSRLLQKRRWTEAARVGDAFLERRLSKLAPRTKADGPTAVATCDGVRILTLHAKANAARFGQRREAFLSFQESFVGELERTPCTPAEVGLEDDDFRVFVIDSHLWLARLLWEKGRLIEAGAWAERAANAAREAGDWSLFLESAQVLVGRVAYEARTPQDALALLEKLTTQYQGPEGEDFTVWAALRKGLLAFLAKDFVASERAFDSLLALETEGATRSQAWYWKGRAQAAQGLAAAAVVSFQKSGQEDPLSYYDVLSGQLVSTVSGLASTPEATPFEEPWRDVQERWIRMRVGKPFALFRPELWFGDDAPGAGSPAASQTNAASPLSSGAGDALADDALRRRRRTFENAVSSSLLLATALRAGLGVETFEKFTTHLRDSGSVFSRLLRSEALWAKQSYSTFYGSGHSHFPSAVRIAWLLHALGDYRSAIPFVALFKNELLQENEDLAFLYFIFYPKPYVAQFTEAARTCSVDADLLYAVARQESLFQPGVVSPAGAIGLMQLMPATARRVLRTTGRPYQEVTADDLRDPSLNTLAGACYLRDLIARYEGNLPHAVAAYNAGEDAVDTWLARRDKLSDATYFTEWIPYQETRDYVQKVLRNYANMKWIYGPR